MSYNNEISSRINNKNLIEQKIANLLTDNAKLDEEIKKIEEQLSKVRQKSTDAQSGKKQNSLQGGSNHEQLNDWNTFHLQEKIKPLEEQLNHKRNERKENLDQVSGLNNSLLQEKSNLENILNQEIESAKKREVEKRRLDHKKIGNEESKREYINIENTVDKAYKAHIDNVKRISACLGKLNYLEPKDYLSENASNPSGTLNSYIVSPDATNKYFINNVDPADFNNKQGVLEKICEDWRKGGSTYLSNSPSISLPHTVPEKEKTNFYLTHYVKK